MKLRNLGPRLKLAQTSLDHLSAHDKKGYSIACRDTSYLDLKKDICVIQIWVD